MKILVMSDSHSSLGFMRMCIDKLRPDVMIHLGDHFDDGTAISEDHPHIRFYQVPGNCDYFRMVAWQPEILCCDIGGVLCYMTHGHRHGVKTGEGTLLAAARAMGAKVALYGHTHCAVCRRDDDLWVINPGSCRGYSGSVALLEVENKEISSCRIIRQEDI